MIRHRALAGRYLLHSTDPAGARWRIVDARHGAHVATITRATGGANLDARAWGIWNRYGEPLGTIAASFRLDEVARLAAYRVQGEIGVLESLADTNVEPPA